MSKEERVCGIYCIENNVNHKKYIGQSVDIYHRWYEHTYELSRNIHHNAPLQNAWNKYGENNFSFTIIERCAAEELDEKEQYYIRIHKTHADFDGLGYNLTTGGDGAGILSEDARQRFREAQKAIPIYQIDLQGNIIRLWEYGAREASAELGIDQSAIWHCVNHSRRTYKGCIWIAQSEYCKSFNIGDYLNQGTQSREIHQYLLDGTFVASWPSANSASNGGFDCSSIIKVCKRIQKSHKGYIWRYANDDDIASQHIKVG